MIVLGKIIDTPAVADDDGNVVTPATYKTGWHVDAPYPVPELEPYRVEPQSPRHTYAGTKTYHYRFADEAEFEAFKAQHTDAEGNWQLTPPPPKAPKSVSARQAHEALIRSGLYQAALDTIDSIQDPVEKLLAENYFHKANEFERDNELLIAMAANMGLDDEQLDDLFREAATL